MSEIELQELELFILHKMFPILSGPKAWTTDAAAAFEVLKKLTERLGENLYVQASKTKGGYCARTYLASATAPTLELAICRLAKQIYSQNL